ncbi:MAG: OmpH family outer membrane protein [Veillonella sp.]|nr:OmpH family outer membrane protein [Veillonella sp.]MCF0156027.1 OmpH family outer membrane protein [Veillonella sp.]
MNFKNKVAILSVLGTMAASAVVGASGIGIINMAEAIHNYPGYGAVELKMKAVDAEYQPKYEKEMQAIQKLNDPAQQQAQYNAKVAPMMQEYEDKIGKLQEPMMKDIFERVEAVRVQKGLDIVLATPQAIVAPLQADLAVVTKDVIDGYKK